MTWLRNIFKSKADQDADLIAAYVDDALSARERARFEARLAEEPALQEEVEAQQFVKATLQDLPQLKAPRNFVLDPAVYGEPERPSIWAQFYPQLRTATAVMSVIFMLTFSLSLLDGPDQLGSQQTADSLAPAATQADMIAQADEIDSFAIEIEAEAESETELARAIGVATPTAASTVEPEIVIAYDEMMAAEEAPTTDDDLTQEGFMASIATSEETLAADTASEQAEAAPISPRATATEDAQRVVTVPPPTPTTAVNTEVAAAPEIPAEAETEVNTTNTTNTTIEDSSANLDPAPAPTNSPIRFMVPMIIGIIAMLLGIFTWLGRRQQI